MDAYNLLLNAGWLPGRQVDMAEEIAALEAEEFTVTDAAATFLREFSGLSIVGPGNRNPLVIGGPDLALDADSGWSDLYSDAIGTTLTPVGEYSNLVLFITADGTFWGGFENEYGCAGSSLDDVIRGLFIDSPGWKLDQWVEA